MTVKTKWLITISTSIVIIASAAVATTVLLHNHKHKEEVKQPTKVSEPVKKVINLPIPIERVRADLSGMFSQERINLIIDEYTKGHFDIYQFYKQLEENK